MRSDVRLACVVALLALSSPANATEKFARKYAENAERTVEVTSKTNQVLTIAGMALETKSSTFALVKTKAGERDADGQLSVTETVTVLQSELELPGGTKLQFDSANPDKKADNPLYEPILEPFRALVKYPATLLIDQDNKVAEVKFADDPKDKLPKELQSTFDPETQKRRRENEWAFLPDGPVEAGAAWERMIERDLGGGQTMNFKMKYVYAGPEIKDGKTYHKFTPQHLEVTYALDPNANPMLKVSQSELKIAKSSGTMLYDPATGEIPLRESSVQITGKLTLVINGTEFPSDLDLTLTEKASLQK